MEITLSTGKKVVLRDGLTGAHQLVASKILSAISLSSGTMNAGDMMLLGQIRTAQLVQRVDGQEVKLPTDEKDLMEILSLFNESELTELVQKTAKRQPTEEESKNSQPSPGSETA